MVTARRPDITAQPREHIEVVPDLTIQALAMHPELLPSYPPRSLKKKKPHDLDCECDKCEAGPDLPELDF